MPVPRRKPPAVRLSPDLDLPVDVATQVTALLGKRGSGKTHTAAVLVEEIVAAGAQVVILDPLGAWWGLTSSADGRAAGLPFVVMGGEHGDLPIEPTAGKVIADLVVDEPVLAVIDLSGFTTGAEQTRFVTDFADRLYRRNRAPLHLVLEEADEFAPERPMAGETKMLGVIQRLVRRGRQRGLGVTLISQRSASLSKGVLTQADVLIAMRTTAPHDQRAIREWISTKGLDDLRDEVMGTLAGLDTGTGWVWAPEMDLLRKIHVRARHTFDSSATPKLGETRIEPVAFAQVDLDALSARIADTIERAAADDPKALRRHISTLEARLADAERHSPTRIETVEVTRDVVPAALADDIAALGERLGDLDRLDTHIAGLIDATRRHLDDLDSLAHDLRLRRQALDEHLTRARTHLTADGRTASPTPSQRSTAPASTPRAPSTPAAQGPGKTRRVTSSIATSAAGEEITLKAGARRILDTLARHHPMRVTKAQAGTLTGFKVTGGTWATYIGTLRRAGLIDVDPSGLFYVTPAGLDHAGVDGTDPLSTDEVLDRWRAALKRGAREMLDHLIAVHPASLTRDELAARVDMTSSGGTFNTYLGTLRRNGLVDVDGPDVRASDALFLAPGA